MFIGHGKFGLGELFVLGVSEVVDGLRDSFSLMVEEADLFCGEIDEFSGVRASIILFQVIEERHQSDAVVEGEVPE